MKKENLGPKHKQIKEDIVEDILGGVYEPGDMIPKQRDYAKKYNVSRLTVRTPCSPCSLPHVCIVCISACMH